MVACTCTAISARAWLVSATSPSIPAVRRPVLRCVTCRTLTSVLLQLRSISFCRLLAAGQSPSRTALKILPRNRRTCPSWCRQSVRSQASPSNEGRPSGPFTEVSNLPISSGTYARSRLKGSPAHVSALPGPDSKIRHPGQLHESHPGGVPGPAAPLSCRLPAARHPLPGHPVLPGNSAPLTAGLPPCLRIPAPARRTLTGFPRSARMRPGPGRGRVSGAHCCAPLPSEPDLNGFHSSGSSKPYWLDGRQSCRFPCDAGFVPACAVGVYEAERSVAARRAVSRIRDNC